MSNMSNMFNSLFGSLRGEAAPGNNENTPYQATQPNELRRTAAGRRAGRQNTVESLIGPLESIALTVPLPDDPISHDWERKYIMDPTIIPVESQVTGGNNLEHPGVSTLSPSLGIFKAVPPTCLGLNNSSHRRTHTKPLLEADVDRVPVVGHGDGHQAGRNGTDDAERRALMHAQFRRVANEAAQLGRQLADVTSDSGRAILARLHTEMTNLIANGGDGAPNEIIATLQNLDLRWVVNHPTEIGFQTWTSLQGHAAAAMTGLQGVVNFLFDETEEEFDPNMQRSFAHLSHIIEQPAIPATEPAEDLDGEDAWILPEGPNSEEVKLVLCQEQQAEEEAEEEKEDEEDKEDKEDEDEEDAEL